MGLPGGFGDGRFNGTMQNVVGPTLVAMATKFGLGAEIYSPTGLLLLLSQSRKLENIIKDVNNRRVTEAFRHRSFDLEF